MPSRNLFSFCQLNFRKAATSCIMVLATLLLPMIVNALPDDRDQPIHIGADSAERDEKADLTTYRGNVVIRQGSLEIKAAEVVIHGSGEAITEISASGKPASFSQQPEVDAELITAEAEHIIYQIHHERIRLLGTASIYQAGTSIQSDRIDYFIEEQRFTATGNTNASVAPDGEAAPTKRVEVTIPPIK